MVRLDLIRSFEYGAYEMYGVKAGYSKGPQAIMLIPDFRDEMWVGVTDLLELLEAPCDRPHPV